MSGFEFTNIIPQKADQEITWCYGGGHRSLLHIGTKVCVLPPDLK